MGETRDRIRTHVHDTPGVHFSRLERDLDLATGQVQYHLRRLLREDRIVSEDIAGRTHYYPPSFDPWERNAIAFLRRESARGIVLRLHADGPKRPCELAEELDLARSTVSWHVSTLDDHDVVERSEDASAMVSLTRPRRTETLLEEVSPSLPDRLVDRFVRTVDTLFE